MNAQLKKSRFLRFFGVSSIGTVADFLMALSLHSVLGVSGVIASTLGFLLGTVLNYLGHHHFTFATGDVEAATIIGFLKYFGAVLASLAVRLLALIGLDGATSLPFWLMLSVAFVASFLCSYVISMLWVFRRKT